MKVAPFLQARLAIEWGDDGYLGIKSHLAVLKNIIVVAIAIR